VAHNYERRAAAAAEAEAKLGRDRAHRRDAVVHAVADAAEAALARVRLANARPVDGGDAGAGSRCAMCSAAWRARHDGHGKPGRMRTSAATAE
jgi:hypothetical protein